MLVNNGGVWQVLHELWRMTKLPQEDVLFTRTYESAGTGPEGKPLSTAMVAMFTDEPGSFSDMHRLPTDEVWHFYGNTMAPGFVPSGFEPGDRAELCWRWPERGELITALTRS